jgi:hypothetical protein
VTTNEVLQSGNITGEDIDRATFAVGHVEDMVKAMQKKYSLG